MRKKHEVSFAKKYNLKWIITITIWTFIMAMIFNLITEGLGNNLGIFLSFLLLAFIIFIGVFFDIIGISVTTAEEKPFHAMAANKVEEAKYAIKLIRNAGPVSNFCNDVIGDISGILSGALSTNIIFRLIQIYDIKNGMIASVIITSVVAAATVGGKAFGKSIALLYSNKIVLKVALIINIINEKVRLDLISSKKDKRNKRIK